MIKNAKYLYDFLFEVTFYDGTVRVVDLEAFFRKDHPAIRKFAKPELARNFYIEDGFICWGDNECEADSVAIYEGKYDTQLAYA